MTLRTLYEPPSATLWRIGGHFGAPVTAVTIAVSSTETDVLGAFSTKPPGQALRSESAIRRHAGLEVRVTLADRAGRWPAREIRLMNGRPGRPPWAVDLCDGMPRPDVRICM
jgi:hypothetical protein